MFFKIITKNIFKLNKILKNFNTKIINDNYFIEITILEELKMLETLINNKITVSFNDNVIEI